MTTKTRPVGALGLMLALASTAIGQGDAAGDSRGQPPDHALQSSTMGRIRQRGAIVVGSAFPYRTFSFKDAAADRCEGFLADTVAMLARDLLGPEGKTEWRFVHGMPGNAAGSSKIEWRFPGDDLKPRHDFPDDVDLVIDCVAIPPGGQPEQARSTDFLDQVFSSGEALLVRKGSKLASIADVTNSSTILYVKTSGQDVDRYLKARAPRAAFLQFEDSRQAFQALRDGRGDILTATVPELYDLACKDSNYTLTCRYTENRIYLFARRDDTVFRDYLRKFVDRFYKSEERARLYDKWFVPFGGNNVN